MSKSYTEVEKERDLIHTILDAQNSMNIICKDKKIKFVNKRFYDYFEGVVDEDLTQSLQKNFNSLEFNTWVAKSYLEKDNTRLIYKKDGIKYTFLINTKKLDYTNDYEYLIVFTDITNQVKQEGTLLSELKEYKEALDTFTIVSKIDINGIITYVNDRFVEISQYSREELIGEYHDMVRHRDTPQSVFKDIWETISHKNIWKGIIQNKKRNGDRCFVETVIIPILDYKNEIQEYLALSIDRTELIESTEEVKKALKAKSMFLANMSHEIRTPLNGIIGFTNLLMKKDLESEDKEIVSIIDASAETLLSIINDILDISKIESEGISLKKSCVNINNTLTAVTQLFQAKAEEKNIKYIVNIDAKESILLDGNRLKQVVSNLIGNAIKFTPEYGTVEVNLNSYLENEKVVVNFSVADSGIGIPKEKQEKIFMPFLQADDDIDKKFGGTGLGLSISAKIIEMMGGKIQVKSQENLGSEFFFQLSFDKWRIQSHSNTIDKSKNTNFQGKILLVEDHPVNQALVKAILNTKGNIEQSVAKNGKFAIEACLNERFDLILMDINMPIMNGIEAKEHIQKYEEQNNFVHTPIIALTANAMEGDEKKFLDLGFDDYLAKPFQERELDAILKMYLHTEVNVDNILNKIIEEVNIDTESYLEIVKIFFENINIDMKELKASIKSENFQDIFYNAHKISGSCSAVRFEDMLHPVSQIERNSRDSQDVNYKEIYKKLEKALLVYKKAFHI